jgi:hypothetical protein
MRPLARSPLVLGALRAALLVAAVAANSSCSERVEVGYDLTRGGANASGGVNSGGAAQSGQGGVGGGGSAACVRAECQGKEYACGNCDDDDLDGKIDALDPDCLGPCDNTEESYFLGIPGQGSGSCRQECHFDRDSGAGNDGCDWSFTCDPRSPSVDPLCAYDPQAAIQGRTCAELAGAQDAACLDYCLPLTPNGCDCFGCCELPARSGKHVWIGSTSAGAGSCSRDTLSDPAACRPCTQVPSCLNECKECELCAGETALPASCSNPVPVCEGGRVACGPGASCPAAMFCITGCCVDVPR